MQPYGYDDDFLMNLEHAFKCLPNIKPRKAREILKFWQEQVFNKMIEGIDSNNEKDVYELNIGEGIVLTSIDFDHLLYDNGYSAIKITPEGAEILIEIYQKGLFDILARKKLQQVSDEIIQYSQSRDSTLENQRIEKEIRIEEYNNYQELIENPETVNIKDFSYKLLNDIFIKHFGLKIGSYSMEIAGILVNKSVHMYSSNSGKSRDSNVIFTWINADGQQKEIKKRGLYTHNRRNDPDRNWGLPE